MEQGTEPGRRGRHKRILSRSWLKRQIKGQFSLFFKRTIAGYLVSKAHAASRTQSLIVALAANSARVNKDFRAFGDTGPAAESGENASNLRTLRAAVRNTPIAN
jgi:hypothetical protein